MRATDLGFRSPKEKTAGFNHPIVTFDGRSLPIVHNKAHVTIGKARRFSQYDDIARRTYAGPGSYDLTYEPGQQWKVKGSPVYRGLHQNRDTSDNGFYFFGHSMVYEPSYVLKSKVQTIRHSDVPINLNLKDSSRGTENPSNPTISEAETKPESKRTHTSLPRRRKPSLKSHLESPYLQDLCKSRSKQV